MYLILNNENVSDKLPSEKIVSRDNLLVYVESVYCYGKYSYYLQAFLEKCAYNVIRDE